MMGVALCLIGILSLVIADIRGPRNTPGKGRESEDCLSIEQVRVERVRNV